MKTDYAEETPRRGLEVHIVAPLSELIGGGILILLIVALLFWMAGNAATADRRAQCNFYAGLWRDDICIVKMPHPYPTRDSKELRNNV